MFITYAPEDGESRSWEFLPNRIRASERKVIEKQFSGTWTEFVTGVSADNTDALSVLLCHLFRRELPGYQLRDVPDFMGCELTVEQSPTELQNAYDKWVKAGGLTTENGPMLHAMFLSELEEATAKHGEPEGKAPSRNESVVTPGP